MGKKKPGKGKKNRDRLPEAAGPGNAISANQLIFTLIFVLEGYAKTEDPFNNRIIIDGTV